MSTGHYGFTMNHLQTEESLHRDNPPPPDGSTVFIDFQNRNESINLTLV